MLVKVLKKDCIITGLDVSSGFYLALQGVLWKLCEDKEDNKDHIEVILLLLQDLDKLAQEQGLIEEEEVSDVISD